MLGIILGGIILFVGETAGAKNIYLYVTHAEHTMVEGDMYNQDIVKKIFTTDSIFKPEWDTRGKVEIVR